MNDELNKPYNPTEHEDLIYKKWEDSGFFNPDVCIKNGVTAKDADYFSIVLPPPNATGTLHMGHAFEDTIQDVMIRYQRMSGKKTLWVPGTDHAATATHAKVEKILQKEEGKNRHDIGKEEFVKRIEKFVEESRGTILKQLRKMGSSLDWSREAFTLDDKRNLVVKTIFKNMYDDGLIYRGYRVVNWDPKGQTTISDDEVEYEERKAIMYTFKYSDDFPIAISTTRPETKVGDTAVAVHPNDERYKKFVGQTFEVSNFAGEKLSIKIVADESVDPEFGTGALGVTPAHSQIDWEIAQRNNLPLKPVINEYARMSVESPLLKDKKTTEAREIVAQWLRNQKLMIEEKEISQNISIADRSKGIVEPLPKLQWFVNVNKEFTYPFDTLSGIKKGQKVTLKKLMLSAVENKNIEMIPDRFEKVYTNWIGNLRDWCISRQIWYGHRIPVWYRSTNTHDESGSEVYCGIEEPKGEGWVQDEDTLDTWFSSGTWTFSTLGWPENTSDLKTYHPTTFMCPGYELIFFWVARMILMATYAVGQIPFKTVYFHGMVRDAKGRKFSKSLDNGIDPIDVSNQYGTDALRMALTVGIGPGNDSKFDFAKVKAYKNFANKIWNIARFVLNNTPNNPVQKPDIISEKDAEYIKEFDDLTKDITTDMENYRFYLAAEKLYHYVWHTFADKIIEESKEKLQSMDKNIVASTRYVLRYILETSLKLLHPFMPFITEKIWSLLPDSKNLLMVEKWPVR
jgi:valyl-tRNA synthetase